MDKSLYVIIPAHVYMSKLVNNPDIKLGQDLYGMAGNSRTVSYIVHELLAVAVHNASANLNVDHAPINLSLPVNEPGLPPELIIRLERLADVLKYVLIAELHKRRAYSHHQHPFLHTITHDGLIIHMEPLQEKLPIEICKTIEPP